MLAKLKNWGLFLWMKKQKDERRRKKDLKEVEKQEKLWDMRLKGLR